MNNIITISREFGSGGRELGKRLADELKYSYYDSELITEISKETGMTEEYIHNIFEKGIYPYAFHFAKSFSMYSSLQSNQTDILVVQQKILKEIAQSGNCIIVGRGADIILEDFNPLNIFVYADMDSKLNRCKEKADEKEMLSDKDLKKKIIQIDKDREKFYSLLSSLKWGDKSNYHLCINTSGIEIKSIVSAVANYAKSWFSRGK